MSAPRDAKSWAPPVEKLEAGGKGVEGRRLTGPMQGFGPLWQKTYRVRVDKKTPAEVIAVWKAEYDRFWPETNKFYAPLAGIRPGEVGRMDGKSGPVTLSTGVMVLFSDETSFAYMTPEGHPFAGWITFSAFEEDEATIAQVEALIRPNDPIYDMGFMMFGNRQEDRMWAHTLRALADFLGTKAEPETVTVKVDRRRQWKHFRNIRYNGVLKGLFRR